MRRTPLILHRHLTADLLRLVAVTTVALVAVIAFAGAIKPLADGRLTLGQALRFMGFLTIPMLQFALPFAAGFSATLTYHRFAADNEAMAASAGGLGHRALLTPALALGAALSILLGVMGFEVIPPLLREAQRVLVTDGTRVLANQLNRGEAVRLSLGGADAIDLYADSALPPQEPEPGTESFARGVDRIITLRGVLATQMRDERPPVFVSAERVFLFVFDPDERTDETSVQLVFENAVANIDGTTGQAQRQPTGRLVLPSELADDPKFLTWRGMNEAERTPRTMGQIDEGARILGARLTERDALRAIRARLEEDGGVLLEVGATTLEGAGTTTLELRASGLTYDPAIPDAEDDTERAERRAQRERTDRWRLAPVTPGGRIVVVRRDTDGTVRTHLADAGALLLPLDAPGRDQTVARFVLELDEVVTLEGVPAGRVELTGSEPRRAELASDRLLPAGLDASALTEAPLDDLLERAERDDLADDALAPRVSTAVDRVVERWESMRREIMSKRHERLAFAVACLFMVLAGAAIGMVMRDSLPLPVYLWSFLPALACVLAIKSGQRFAYREGPIGLLLLWGGVVALALLFAYFYAKLRRH